jgi:hypothetical protein
MSSRFDSSCRRAFAPLLLTGLLVLGGVWLAWANSPAYGAHASLPGPRQADVVPMAPVAPGANLIANGGFEDGFQNGVGQGWASFANGSGQVGWYDDTWAPVVYQGAHSQLLSMKDVQATDRFVGIYQTVAVVPNTDYILTLHGLVRSDPASIAESNWGYRMQFGVDFRGGTDWQAPDPKRSCHDLRPGVDQVARTLGSQLRYRRRQPGGIPTAPAGGAVRLSGR